MVLIIFKIAKCIRLKTAINFLNELGIKSYWGSTKNVYTFHFAEENSGSGLVWLSLAKNRFFNQWKKHNVYALGRGNTFYLRYQVSVKNSEGTIHRILSTAVVFAMQFKLLCLAHHYRLFFDMAHSLNFIST